MNKDSRQLPNGHGYGIKMWVRLGRLKKYRANFLWKPWRQTQPSSFTTRSDLTDDFDTFCTSAFRRLYQRAHTHTSKPIWIPLWPPLPYTSNFPAIPPILLFLMENYQLTYLQKQTNRRSLEASQLPIRICYRSKKRCHLPRSIEESKEFSSIYKEWARDNLQGAIDASTRNCEGMSCTWWSASFEGSQRRQEKKSKSLSTCSIEIKAKALTLIYIRLHPTSCKDWESMVATCRELETDRMICLEGVMSNNSEG